MDQGARATSVGVKLVGMDVDQECGNHINLATAV